ncbi:hypothetical protein GCM10022238_19030 [Gordonia hankookensis]
MIGARISATMPAPILSANPAMMKTMTPRPRTIVPRMYTTFTSAGVTKELNPKSNRAAKKPFDDAWPGPVGGAAGYPPNPPDGCAP